MNMNGHTEGPTDFLNNIGRVFTGFNDRLEKPVRDHLRNVYATVGAGVGAAALGASIHLFTDAFMGSLLMTFVWFGLLLSLFTMAPTRENQRTRLGLFFGFCAVTGVNTGPLLRMAVSIEPSIVMSAFIFTTFVFGCFTLSALNANSTKYLHLGGVLSSATLCLLLSSFIISYSNYIVLVWGGLAIMCGFVLYDTQMIIDKARRGEDDYILHAVLLFNDFASIFKKILILLMNKNIRDEENNRKKRRN